MLLKRFHIFFLFLFLPLTMSAECNHVLAESDRPGVGTGTNVLDRGFIQWETGFEVAHLLGMHAVTLPTTLFRFGLCPWAELRLEYTGVLGISGLLGDTLRLVSYVPEPLNIGAKLRIWEGSDKSQLRWIPRTSVLLNLGVPLTSETAKIRPIGGAIDFLFENDLAEWVTMGYNLGVYWLDWAPTPDIFASLGFSFSPTDKLGLFIDSNNSFDVDAYDPATPNKFYTVYNIGMDFGVTYLVHPRVQLDAYAAFNLYHTEPLMSGPRNNVSVGFGVTWLLNHPASLDSN